LGACVLGFCFVFLFVGVSLVGGCRSASLSICFCLLNGSIPSLSLTKYFVC
jgi:hypothetical protein